MKSRIIIILILLAIVIGVVVFGLRTKAPGTDIINDGKPMSEESQATVLERLASPVNEDSEYVKEQESLLDSLAATSTASSSNPGPTEDEQRRILESLQAK